MAKKATKKLKVKKAEPKKTKRTSVPKPEPTVPETPAATVEPVPPDHEKVKTEIQAASLEALRATVDREKTHVEEVEQEMQKRLAEAKQAYRDAVAAYRAACKTAGVEPEIEDAKGRAPAVSDRVGFEVEIQGKHVRIAVRGRAETEEKIPLEEVKAGPNKVAYAFTGRHLGSREEIGNKGGGLSNRLRALLAKA